MINLGQAHAAGEYELKNLHVVNTIYVVAGLASAMMSAVFYAYDGKCVSIIAAIASLLYFLCLGINFFGYFFLTKICFSVILYLQCIINHIYWGFPGGFWLYFLNFTQVAFIFSPRMSAWKLKIVSAIVYGLLLATVFFLRQLNFDKANPLYPEQWFFIGNLAFCGFAFILAINYLNTHNLRTEQDLKIALKAAHAADEAKSEFLSNVSHEMRTPLNAVSGFSEYLANHLSEISDEQVRERFGEKISLIHGASQSLTAIINDILDYERLQSGRIVLLSEKFALRKLVDSVIASINQGRTNNEVTLTASVDSDVPNNFISDAARINQILINLISNAIKFTQKGHVTLHCSLTHRLADIAKLTMVVSDTGIGIPQDSLDEIFERFSKASLRTGLRFRGTGLGLAITKTLVNALGGKIAVYSEIGKGSKFTIELPLRTTTDPAAHSENELHGFHGIRVLVAEDNEVNQLLVQTILESWGIIARYAADGLQAVELFNTDSFDLVLLDLQMPYMDGFEVLHVIRNHTDVRKQKIPVIALTADALHETREKCFEQGMNDIVLKPISLEVLHSTIKAVFANRLVYQI